MAFSPYQTLSGSSFPVLTGQTAGAALSKGTIAVKGVGGAGTWTQASAVLTAATDRGQLGVVLATVANGATNLAVCLVTPDVVFLAPVPTAGTALTAAQPYRVNGTTGVLIDVQATAATNIPCTVIGPDPSTNLATTNVLCTIGYLGG